MSNTCKKRKSHYGFSMIELMVVMLIVIAMTTIALYYAMAHKKAFRPDEEALQVLDVLQEARQRALTQRRVMRVEINATTNKVSLIDENANSASTSDDAVIRSLNLYAPALVNVSGPPSDITYNPPEPLPVPSAVFKISVYPSSVGQSVCTMRFLPNGTVTDAGTNSTGSGAVPTGVTLHVWSPDPANTAQSVIARAVTVLGATGSVRLWEFNRNSTATNKWKDSRRSG